MRYRGNALQRRADKEKIGQAKKLHIYRKKKIRGAMPLMGLYAILTSRNEQGERL